MTTPALDLSDFGERHFGHARLGDCRRTRCLVDLARRFAQHPGGSLPDKCADPKALRRCYDLMNRRQVTHAAVLEAHCQETFRALRAHHGVVLELHDTTELDFSSRHTLRDQLGPIGNGRGRGFLCHQSLAVVPGLRQVLGLTNQILHLREPVPPGETVAAKRERESRESRLWVEAVQASHDRRHGRPPYSERPAPLPADLLLVDVCDRGADTFEFLKKEAELGRHYVVRLTHDRGIRVGHEADGPRAKLQTHLRTLPEQGRRELTVRGRNGQPDRRATVAVAWAAVLLLAPQVRRGQYEDKRPIALWAVRVWEEAPPAGVEPVEWFLVSDVAVRALADAWERADWYATRWVIEELHKAEKTGCAIEAPQFTTREALEPLLALLSVVALVLLDLRLWARDEQAAERPATEVLDGEYVEVLSGWRYGEKRPLTVREALWALGRLGGHQNRKGDGPPGWLVLWRGWTKLQAMVEGARAARCPPAAPPPQPKKKRPRKSLD
jgi:hypothetical protein